MPNPAPPSHWAIKKAQEIRQRDGLTYLDSLARHVEMHEAFRRKVSRAVTALRDHIDQSGQYPGGVKTEAIKTKNDQWIELSDFIIDRPDPMAAVLCEMGYSKNADVVEQFRALVAKHGGKISFEGDD